MKDVLSQNEIDSLIHALSTGEIAEEEPQTSDTPVKVYDFRRPNKFSKDQMRTLQIVHENFARILSNFLTAYLRTPVQVTLASVSQVTFEEFIFSLPTPTLMSIFKAADNMGSAMLETNPQFVFPIIDLLFGGEGKTPKQIRELTEIELTVMRRIVNKILENLRYAWEDINELSPQIENMDTNPQFNQMIASNETVALLTLSTKIRDSEGLINVCFPFITLEPVIANLTAQHWFSNSQNSGGVHSRLLETGLEDVDVELTAVLGSSTVQMEDFLQFEEGDVILLDQRVDCPMTLLVEEKPMFKIQAGVSKGRRAVQFLNAEGGEAE
ncbi:flagellar motor switch protein FliM [Dethiobacter alkaliphilus]|uniref:flagellar motor switch protein FliM n=1 Tax=Dethiobacter alkaliphilus TaxID=427926 RepID=UPI0022268A7B|nr:flagellar motor switch protein FliM [Dethiobacter alkaliphilus]MCW3488719.1 flagellar motor switch protein FliM [Dethiobacter alkaliphilus]